MTENELLEKLHYIKTQIDGNYKKLKQLGFSNNDTVELAKNFHSAASYTDELIVDYMPIDALISNMVKPNGYNHSDSSISMDDDHLLSKLNLIEKAMVNIAKSAMKLDCKNNPNIVLILQNCLSLSGYIETLYCDLCTVEYLIDFMEDIGEPVQNREPSGGYRPQIDGQVSFF